jgi:mono/diheme cytochrome c family protein
MRYLWLIILGSLLVWAGPAFAEDDAAIFGSRCAACHGADGRARTPQGKKMKAKDLRDSRLTEAEVEQQIREGSRLKTGLSVMPAVGRDMTEAEIKATIRVVLAFRPPVESPK